MRYTLALAPIPLFAGLVLAGCTDYYHERIAYSAQPDSTIIGHTAPPDPLAQGPAYDEPPPSPPPAFADDADDDADLQPEEAVTTFYSDLQPYGQWIDVSGYGRCWHPRGVAADWRPYTVGHWVYDDDYGWMWDSDEPWGYATCHYGRWALDTHHGWIWIPGTVWAPAWVAWRSGDGFVGWAPLPPRARFGADLELHVSDIPANHFCFIHERDFGDTHIHQRIVNVRENVTIIRQTTNITRIRRENNRVVVHGPDLTRIERDTGHKIQRVKVRQVNSLQEARRLREQGHAVAYRPSRLVQARREQNDRRDHQRSAPTPGRARENQPQRSATPPRENRGQPERTRSPERAQPESNRPARSTDIPRQPAPTPERTRTQQPTRAEHPAPSEHPTRTQQPSHTDQRTRTEPPPRAEQPPRTAPPQRTANPAAEQRRNESHQPAHTAEPPRTRTPEASRQSPQPRRGAEESHPAPSRSAAPGRDEPARRDADHAPDRNDRR